MSHDFLNTVCLECVCLSLSMKSLRGKSKSSEKFPQVDLVEWKIENFSSESLLRLAHHRNFLGRIKNVFYGSASFGDNIAVRTRMRNMLPSIEICSKASVHSGSTMGFNKNGPMRRALPSHSSQNGSKSIRCQIEKKAWAYGLNTWRL